ncbi:MAG: DUF1080 domain-containing protein [Planctomycetia bacterium]|nr:DUF1080 domain-containing protein [Planctomycetia bacterium]
MPSLTDMSPLRSRRVASPFRGPSALVGLANVGLALALACGSSAVTAAPSGFTALFNGRDLAGWRGRPHLDPAKEAEAAAADRESRQRQWNDDLAAHWKVEGGEIVSDGHGVFLTTDRDYGDFELLFDWMMPAPCADSGVYLRGLPQVQLWDPACERDFKHGCEKGSGGLWNNPPDSAGRFPAVKADRPIGEWNTMRILMQGERVTVELNGQVVVERAALANYFAKGQPLPASGPIQIQTHGAPLRLKNLFIRDLAAAGGPSFDLAATGWRDLGAADFADVNCGPDTWTWAADGVRCTGKPVGVIRTKQPLTNFEMSLEWRHLSDGGNSGVFLWSPLEVLESIKPGQLPPGGIEVQVLDHGYTAAYEKATGKKADWFTTDGDVFPVGSSKMKPFPPVAPNGQRSFPTSRHSRGFPEWNHYFIRATDGEVRLWVNGHQVSGGAECRPATGHLCLESEGAPVEFRRLKLRPLDGGTSAPGAAADAEAGFVPLFDGATLAGWQGNVAGYEVVDGEIRCRKGAGGNLLTTGEYDDFVLRFEFRLTPGANNGLGIRAPAQGDAAFAGMELQILDDASPKYAGIQPWQVHGSIYGVVAAERGALRPAGEWNSEEVTVKGSQVTVTVNGRQIVDADIAPFRDGRPTPDGKPHPGLSRTTGHIGFLGHGDEVHFRNIRIRSLR